MVNLKAMLLRYTNKNTAEWKNLTPMTSFYYSNAIHNWKFLNYFRTLLWTYQILVLSCKMLFNRSKYFICFNFYRLHRKHLSRIKSNSPQRIKTNVRIRSKILLKNKLQARYRYEKKRRKLSAKFLGQLRFTLLKQLMGFSKKLHFLYSMVNVFFFFQKSFSVKYFKCKAPSSVLLSNNSSQRFFFRQAPPRHFSKLFQQDSYTKVAEIKKPRSNSQSRTRLVSNQLKLKSKRLVKARRVPLTTGSIKTNLTFKYTSKKKLTKKKPRALKTNLIDRSLTPDLVTRSKGGHSGERALLHGRPSPTKKRPNRSKRVQTSLMNRKEWPKRTKLTKKPIRCKRKKGEHMNIYTTPTQMTKKQALRISSKYLSLRIQTSIEKFLQAKSVLLGRSVFELKRSGLFRLYSWFVTKSLPKNYAFLFFQKDLTNIVILATLFRSSSLLSFYLARLLERVPRHTWFFHIFNRIVSVFKLYCGLPVSLKVLVKGRVNKQLRKQSVCVLRTNVNLSTLKNSVDYSLNHSFTKASVLGVKVWIISNSKAAAVKTFAQRYKVY